MRGVQAGSAVRCLPHSSRMGILLHHRTLLDVCTDVVISAVNLLHYVALRSRDLRSFQMRLARAGLSSLGRAESHVLAAVDAVLAVLHRAVGRDWQPEKLNEPPVDRNVGAIFWVRIRTPCSVCASRPRRRDLSPTRQASAGFHSPNRVRAAESTATVLPASLGSPPISLGSSADVAAAGAGRDRLRGTEFRLRQRIEQHVHDETGENVDDDQMTPEEPVFEFGGNSGSAASMDGHITGPVFHGTASARRNRRRPIRCVE